MPQPTPGLRMNDAAAARSSIDELERAVASFLAQVRSIAPDRWFSSQELNAWSPAEISAHVTEMLPYWAGQASILASSDGVDVVSFGRTHDDEDRIAAVARGRAVPMPTAIERIERAAGEAVALLSSIPDDRWGRLGSHPTRGAMTVGGLLQRFMVQHIHEHEEQLRTSTDGIGMESP